jgi:Sec-independent protein translocase protein TatA
MRWWQWVILAIVLALIFRTMGAANAGSAAGHAAHNVGTAISAFFSSL